MKTLFINLVLSATALIATFQSSVAQEKANNPISRIKAVAWASNRLDIFVVGTDKQLYHKA